MMDGKGNLHIQSKDVLLAVQVNSIPTSRIMGTLHLLFLRKAWAITSLPAKAPSNDLNLLKLQLYHTINTSISNATVQKMAGQLWFLSEQLVSLALFGDHLDNGTKDKMFMAMKEKEGEEEPLKCATIYLKFIQEKTVVDFTTKNSTHLFKKFDLPEDFLKYSAAQWKHQPIMLQKASSACWLLLVTMLNILH